MQFDCKFYNNLKILFTKAIDRLGINTFCIHSVNTFCKYIL